ncbi:hypothetical protein EV1_023653 [Malus domestica]
MMQQPSGGVHPQQVLSDPQQQYQQAPQQYAATQNPGSDEIRALWIGDLLQWMDEAYILSCFGPTGEAVNAKGYPQQAYGSARRLWF